MKTMKKVLSVILIAVMLLTAAPLSGFVGLEWPEIDLGAVFAPKAEAETEGYFTYIIENGQATITDVSLPDVGDVFIPDTLGGYTVSSIDADAFDDCADITSFSVSENNKHFSTDENGVLFNKDKTVLIKYPERIESEIYITPDSVTRIADKAFTYNVFIRGVILQSGVEYIGKQAFSNCCSLEEVALPESVKVIDDEAFAYCDALVDIFPYEEDVEIVMPENAADYTVDENGQITYIGRPVAVIPGNVDRIGKQAFYCCSSLYYVKIPDSVTTIGFEAFDCCSLLLGIIVDEDNVNYCNDSYGVLFNKAQTELIQYPIGNKTTSYTIPNGVSAIGDSAFECSWTLTEIIFPESLISIGNNAFYSCCFTSIEFPERLKTIGDFAFDYCTELTNITFHNGLTSIGKYAFGSCKKLTQISPFPDSLTSIGDCAFIGCEKLQSVDFPDNMTNIGSYAFSGCKKLENIELPNGISAIADGVFDCCAGLKKVIIPEGVKSIGEASFCFCDSLEKITLPDSLMSIGNDAFTYCTSLSEINIPFGVVKIGSAAFSTCDSLRSITIPASVKSIGSNAFATCMMLTSLTFEAKVTNIDSFMFYGCGNLTDINIPDTVETIGDYAFYNTNITSINIPAGVTSIGNGTFEWCNKLSDVYYDGNQDSWNNIEIYSGNESLQQATIHFGKIDTDTLTWVVEDDGTLIISGTGPMTDYTSIDRAPWYGQTSKIKRVVIEDGVTSIGDYAFFGCAGFTSIEIADSVTIIGNCAFYECQSLSGISLPANLEAIGESAFFNCKRLTAISIPAELTSIADDAFLDCKSIAAFTVHEENPVYCSENGVLFNKDKSALVCYPACKLDTQYSVPDGVFAILDSAFYNCAALEAITLPESLQSIGEFAFRNCTNLLSLHIPADVTAIGNGAFINTVRLVSLTASIDNTAFCTMDNVLYNKDMSELICCAAEAVPIEFVVPQSVQVIRDFAFDGCATMCAISIGKKLSRVGKSAFATCTYLCVAYYGGSESQWDAIDFGAFNSPLLTAEKHFCGSTTYKGLTAYFEDSFFESDSVNYNHELAKFCALFTVIGYNENYSQPDVVMQKLIDCGFTVDIDNIVNDAGQEEVNHFIAHQEILVDGEWQTLIFAGFIGSYLKQWISNFDPGTGKTHKGFTNAKNYVYERLENYIKELGIEKDKTKILLTGHSRGAATCNLVARELISNGKYASPDSIYAYAFATPNSTCLPERLNAEYKRIFNIVNPEDLVTKMIPTAWGGKVGYGRYGTTYTLPSATNDAAYSNLLQNMQVVFEDMMGEKYHPFPGGEEETYLVVNDLTKVVKSLDEFYETKFYWHSDFVDKPGTLVTIQQFLTQTVASYKAFDGTEKQDEVVKKMKNTFVWNLSEDVIQSLTDYFVKYQGLDGIPIVGWVTHPYFDNAHSAATYCAYTFTMSEEQMMIQGTERKSYNGTVNCPVDVEIYNKATGELVGRIVNNVVDEEIAAQENAVVMSVDGDSKSFWLPSNGDYEVKLIGNDEGTMDYTISEIDSDIGEVKRANFFDVEITDGFTMTADMSSDDFAIEEAELVLEDGSTLLPSEIMDEGEITSYTIEITATAGGTAGSSRTVNSGDYVSLSAVANEGWEFVGWFENDELISAETEFAFVAKSDRTLTARFEQSAPAFTLGDIDNDGNITSSDARSALRAAVGLDTLTETQQKAADVNKDGAVTSTDARSILRCAVGLEAF